MNLFIMLDILLDIFCFVQIRFLEDLYNCVYNNVIFKGDFWFMFKILVVVKVDYFFESL